MLNNVVATGSCRKRWRSRPWRGFYNVNLNAGIYLTLYSATKILLKLTVSKILFFFKYKIKQTKNKKINQNKNNTKRNKKKNKTKQNKTKTKRTRKKKERKENKTKIKAFFALESNGSTKTNDNRHKNRF